MTDLASWLLAQIADDEAAARAATPGPWWTDGVNASRIYASGESDWLDVATEIDTSVAAHIARHDPARVLAECAAKRAIVELCAAEIDNGTDGAATASSVLYWLAQPYADRPGFDPAWKVET